MEVMGYFLTRQSSLKWLETPSVYQIARDELYELDEESFRFLAACATYDGCEKKHSAFVDYCIEEGLLTEEPVLVRRPLLTPSPKPSLRYLELQITNKCNLRCKHCYIGDSKPQELRPSRIKAVLEEFEEMQGLRVLITGGEPIMHSRFDEINDFLPDLFVRKVLFTNGTLLTKNMLKKLKIHEIQVSIDGMKESHDALRGAGTWDAAISALRSSQDAGFDVSVSTMVTSANLKDFDAMDEYFRSIGVREWSVDVPCRTGRMALHQNFSVAPEIGGKYLGYGFGGGMHAAEHGYACGLHLMAVLPDGNAAKCTFYQDKPVGNIAEGLGACWNKIQPIRLDMLECSCEYLEACRGGCRYRAEIFDHPGGRDFFRCALYGLIDKSE